MTVADGWGDYQPVDCAFHDQLVERATFRRPTKITYRHASDGAPVETSDVIEDVFSRAGAEYLRLQGGQEIRLDSIVRVDDVR